MNLYQSIASMLLRFEREIPITTTEPIDSVIKKVYETDPRCIFYIAQYSYAPAAPVRTLVVDYRNTEYPPSQIYVVRQHEEETVLRNAVSAWQRRLVIAFPGTGSGNFEWTLKCFMNKYSAFYPNIVNYMHSFYKVSQSSSRVYDITFNYRIGTAMLRKMTLDTQQEVERLKRLLFRPGMPDEAKCLIAHNYLADTITYDNNDKGNPLERSYLQCAYGALINKRCVCQGFAEAYRLLVTAAGIRCELVNGEVLTIKEGNRWHAWNIVHLNGGKNSYHVDVTWDGSRPKHVVDHFLKGDEFYIKDREWNRFYYKPCIDGSALMRSASNYLLQHERELTAAGIRKEWLR